MLLFSGKNKRYFQIIVQKKESWWLLNNQRKGLLTTLAFCKKIFATFLNTFNEVMDKNQSM
jgi:hypothetical protein